MTLPTPPTPPSKLNWITVPLLALLFVNALGLLLTPFLGPELNNILEAYGKMMGVVIPPLTQQAITTVLWLSVFLSMVLILWLYYTRRAVLEGKRWGRISSIVIAVLMLLNFPIGTILAVIMFIGIFDRDVMVYTDK